MAPERLQAVLDLEESAERQGSTSSCLGDPGAHPEDVAGQPTVGAHRGFTASCSSSASRSPRRRSPSTWSVTASHRRKSWRAFLDNHVKDLVSIDFFTVPTVTFKVLFVFVVLAHERRRVIHFNVTESPSAKWTAQQIVEAFPWDTAPRYLLRDRDGIYGHEFTSRVESHGHQGSEDGSAITLAKSLRGAPDRNPTPRLHRPCDRRSTRITCAGFFEIISPTITVAGRTCRWRRTPRNRGRWSRPTKGRSSSSRWLADSIIATHDRPPRYLLAGRTCRLAEIVGDVRSPGSPWCFVPSWP